MAQSPERKVVYQAQYRLAKAEELRAAGFAYRRNLKTEALQQYGTCCQKCGFDDQLALVIDHIDDSGAEERRSLGGRSFAGWRFYLHLRKLGWPEGYQTLCANCNMIKQQLRWGL